MRKSIWSSLLSLAVVGAIAMPALARGGGAGGAGRAGRGRGNAANPGGANPGGANPGGGRNGRNPGGPVAMDPAALLQARLNTIKGQLGATDAEWTVLSDKLSKVITLQNELNVGKQQGGGGRGARGNGGNPAPAGPTPLPAIVVDQANPVSVAADDLNKSVADTGAAADSLKGKLQALRDARTKIAADLKKAQDDLKEVVTVRQEAILVSIGILE